MVDTTAPQQGHLHEQGHEQPGQGQETVAAGAELGSSGSATATVRLPFGSVSVSLPQVKARVGGQQGAAGTTPGGTGGTGVERLALYGGAALLGALGVLEWPVVLAAAGGTFVLSQLAGRSSSGSDPSGSPVHAPHGDHDHAHGPDCGHAVVPHGDHSDYLHDGHRHAAHGDHWDEH